MSKYGTFRLTVATVSGPLFDGEVVSCTLPGSEGEFTIMRGHEPLVTTLQAGDIRLVEDEESPHTVYRVTGGILEVHKNSAIVLI